MVSPSRRIPDASQTPKRKRGRPRKVPIAPENESNDQPKAKRSRLNDSSKSRVQEKICSPTGRRSTDSSHIKTTADTPSRPSPRKTRRLHKESQNRVPRCTLCKKQNIGELKQCSKCFLYYHLRRCLEYSEELQRLIDHKDDWLCPKCIRCAVCEGMVDDPTNVECASCFKAFHNRCQPPGSVSSGRFYYCNLCVAKSPSKINKRKSKDAPKMRNRDVTNPLAALVTPQFPLVHRPTTQAQPVKRGRGRLSKQQQSLISQQFEQPVLDEESVEMLREREELYDQLLDHRTEWEDNLGSPSTSLPILSKLPGREHNGSPEKRQELPVSRIALNEDIELFLAAKREADRIAEHGARSKGKSRPLLTTESKWVHLGSEAKVKALYPSPYPEEILNGSELFVCSFCLTPMKEKEPFLIHQVHCSYRHPPGNEIYRNEEISFFEVDGAKQQAYCRNLCLLAKMFIESKTLYYEVDTFLFYVLTEITSDGCTIAGYFSKERNPNKNNNLSCLLTLPHMSKKGYGRLLIDMSYELSRLERRVGHPEHPISDLGLNAYRKFWRSSILCFLRSVRNQPHSSIKSMSLATRIYPEDLIGQMVKDGLLVYKDGTYYVKTGRRAYKFPLSATRRPVIDTSKLRWKSSNDITMLDPSKINVYA